MYDALVDAMRNNPEWATTFDLIIKPTYDVDNADDIADDDYPQLALPPPNGAAKWAFRNHSKLKVPEHCSKSKTSYAQWILKSVYTIRLHIW